MDEQHQPTRETMDRDMRADLECKLAHAMKHHPEKLLANMTNLIMAHCGDTGDGMRSHIRKD